MFQVDMILLAAWPRDADDKRRSSAPPKPPRPIFLVNSWSGELVALACAVEQVSRPVRETFLAHPAIFILQV
jgi:hypothetical protein